MFSTSFRRWVVVSFGLALLGLAGCASPGPKAPAVEAWFRAPDDYDRFLTKPPLEQVHIMRVRGPRQLFAQSFLEERAFRFISPELAEDLVGSGVKARGAEGFYLVRAVSWNDTVSDYMIFPDEGDLLVHSTGLGGRKSELRREALVLRLEAAPKAVYSTAWRAE